MAAKFDLTPENMDALLKYVALPKMEKRREETKELDAVWPSWKKDVCIPFRVCYKCIVYSIPHLVIKQTIHNEDIS